MLGLPVPVGNLAVQVMGIADLPTLSASAGPGSEDGALALTISGALTDTDGSERSTYLISGMPAGFMLNRGINNGNGTWSLTAADLAGLQMTPASNWSGAGSLKVSHVATENEGDQAVRQVTVNFNVTPVADAPLIDARAHRGTEDTPLALKFGVTLTDTDGSETISALTVSGLPAGANLTHAVNNGDGTWSVDVAQIGNVHFVPSSNWHGSVTLDLSATSRETANGVTSSTSGTLALTVAPVADTPSIFAADVSDQPHTPIGLNIWADLNDLNGSEQLSVVVSGIPDGARLSAGLNNADGSWTLTPSQLAALSIAPPHCFTGEMHLTATAYSFEADGSSANAHQHFTVHMDYDHTFQS